MATTDQLITPRYRLIAALGEGAMGAVYRVHDRLVAQDVALKRVTLAPKIAADLEADRLALAHEFRMLAGLRHPHIISVFDYGFDVERQPFFTMELLDNAQTILDVGRQQSIELRVGLLTQGLEALAYLHRRGVLHHDLKPANLVVSNGRALLLDFGLSVLADKQRADDAFGTLRYLAPEVIDGQPYTESSDLYSLGVIAYELFAGRHPFPGDTIRIFLDQVFSDEPDLSFIAAPPDLARVVGQLLAKDPIARPPGAQAAITALRAAAEILTEESPAIRESYLQSASFVGREAELALLIDALHQTHRGQGGAWLIGGESGVGKSRLLHELETQALVDGVVVIRGQAIQEGGAAFQLWRDPLRQLLVASTHVDDLTAGVLLPLVPDIGELVGRPVAPAPALESESAHVRLLTSIASLFEQQTEPLLLLLEDLQWAGESLLPLSYLLRAITDRPLLVIGSYRDDERPELVRQLPEMRRLPLPRLSPEHVAALCVAMLGEAGRQPELLARLQQETEGNTFFLVEVVRALAEEAGQLASVGQAELPARMMSRGIEATIARRLAHIPAAAQTLLAQAAIAGRLLDMAVLQALAIDVDLINWWLPLCAEAAVLEVRGQQWQFSHDKLRDGLLARLAPEELRQLHEEVAEVLEQLYGADDVYAGQLAYHWAQAGRADREVAYCLRAGHYARRQGNTAEAARLFSRAFEVTPADDHHTLIDLHLQRGEVQEVLGEWAEAEADYRAALALAEHPEAAAGAQLALGALFSRRSEHRAALEWLGQAQIGYAALEDQHGLAQVFNAEGMVWYRQGEYVRARTGMETALAHGRAVGDAAGIAVALNNLGNVTLSQSDYTAARTLYGESLAIRRSLGDIQGIANCLSNLGRVALSQGDDEEAWALHEESLALRRTMGDKDGIAGSLNNLGIVALSQGDRARGRTLLEQSLALTREIGNLHGLAATLNNLGGLAADDGDYTTARALVEESLALRRALNDIFGMVSSLNNLGDVILIQRDYDAAWELYAESLPLAVEIGDKEGIAYNLASLACLAMAVGGPKRAARLAAATEALLVEIHGALDPNVRDPFDAAIAKARTALGEAAFQAAWDAGERLSLAEVVPYALVNPLLGEPG
jgi:tetratricopeptide (TPR) repeat protein/tRNA A-37 threonylcarbamoyl transferase component Bud32